MWVVCILVHFSLLKEPHPYALKLPGDITLSLVHGDDRKIHFNSALLMSSKTLI